MSLASSSGMTPARQRIVVIGAGFGGLSAVKALKGADADITLIDRRNHHLFQPLLYQTATAALSPNQIASPIRSIVRGQKNVTVVLDEVVGIDRAGRRVLLGDRAIPYDALVIATGARHAYFGRDDWERHAPGLKTIADANAMREKILIAYERAERLDAGPARDRALTFIIVGGGPTGVELAGAIAELSKHALARDFRRTRCADPRVILIEAGPRVLPAFSPQISDYARRALEKSGVEVRTGIAVTECEEGRARIGSEWIEADTLIWAAGVMASPAAQWLGAPADKAGRVVVRGDLSLSDAPDIFVIGDTASAVSACGKVVPGLAPAAKQQGAYVGRLLKRRLEGKSAPRPFRYMDFGSLATVGRNAACAEINGVRLTGFAAWLFWSMIHVYFLIGFRNRILVTLDWLWSYITFERGARLIASEMPHAEQPPAALAAAE